MTRRWMVSATLVLLSVALAAPGYAQVASDDIVRALKPKAPLTRSLTTRKIEVIPGKEAEVLERKDLARIDLAIEFVFDSDRPTPSGERQLVALAEALKNPQLAGYRFVLAGHTDAKGAADYNQRLSERRALAVKQFLIEVAKIQPEKLATVGFGAKRLADTADPFSGRNRRVEVVNILQ